MTRINAGIPVADLSDKHLLAEHREIKRVCHLLLKRIEKNKFSNIPGEFHTVKKGRIAFRTLFWLDKGLYTFLRYNDLYYECSVRKFKVQYYGKNWDIYQKKPEYLNNYEPTEEQVQMIRDRIAERSKPLIQL